MAEKEGVDFVNISRGNKMTAAFRYEVPSMYTPKQFNLDNAVRIKAGVHIPVAGGGRIVDPETAAPYVEDGPDAYCPQRERGHGGVLSGGLGDLGVMLSVRS